MFCRSCGAEAAPYANVCAKCGQPLKSSSTAVEAAAHDPEYLETAVGRRNTDYYLRKFARFESGRSRLSWNWPAFFVTLGWLLYRKMWGYAALYFFALPAAAVVLYFVLALALPEPTAAVLVLISQLAVIFVAVPMFANALYYRVVEKRIAAAKEYSADRERRLRALASDGGTSGAAILIALVVMFVPILGVLAAIAIPAYQDYTIRAQVSEGLVLAAAVRAAVSETIVARGTVPADRAEAGLSPEATATSGKYVESVAVDLGRIDITYAQSAHSAIAGKTLSLTPYGEERDGRLWVVWRCGEADVPPEATVELTIHRPGGIHPRHLQSACRP